MVAVITKQTHVPCRGTIINYYYDYKERKQRLLLQKHKFNSSFGSGFACLRIRMRKIIYILLYVSLTMTETAFCNGEPLPVVPRPREAVFLNESFSFSAQKISLHIYKDDTSGICIPVSELKETFRLLKGINITEEENSPARIELGIPSEDKKFKKLCEENGIWPETKIGSEGYSLLIKNNLILVAANTDAGIYYGVQTLKQLLRGYKDVPYLPGVKIIDYPALKYRGLLDDISRGPVPTIEFMKEQIRRCAELKLNFMQYYTENVVETEKHKKFAPPDGSVTITEWKELAEYARRYHVMLIGNFQSFGHFEKILAHPEYTHLGEAGTLLSPAYPESIELLKDIYTEMVPAFGAPLFNINSDETFDLGKGASKKMVDSLGTAAVYCSHINKIHSILSGLDVRMMIWGDIVLKHPESLEMLPKDIIMMMWNYDPQESFADMIEPVKNAGFEFTVSPGVLNSGSTLPDYSESFPNINQFVKDGVQYNAMGMVCTMWDDGGSVFFSRDWYGAAYAADQGWNSSGPDINEFDKRFNPAVYADTACNFTNAVWQLVSLSKLPPTDGLQEKLLWTKVFPDSSESLRISLDGLDKVMEVLDSAEILLNRAKPLLYAGDIKYFRFNIDQYRYFFNLRINIIKAAEAYKQAFNEQHDGQSTVREKITGAINMLAASRISAEEIISEFRDLWLNENKTHALDSMLTGYRNHVDELKNIEALLSKALQSFDSRSAVPAPGLVRLNISEGEGKYFKDWLMINPVPVEQGSSDTTDYLLEMGGELNARPGVAQEFNYGSATYRWRRTSSVYFDLADLKQEFNNAAPAVTYAYANIDSPDDRTVDALLGSSGSVDVIINGQPVFSRKGSREFNADEDKFELPLVKGRNHLMLKLFSGAGEWKFSFRLPEYNVSNSKNRYKITE
jgi:hypothetical protein